MTVLMRVKSIAEIETTFKLRNLVPVSADALPCTSIFLFRLGHFANRQEGTRLRFVVGVMPQVTSVASLYVSVCMRECVFVCVRGSVYVCENENERVCKNQRAHYIFFLEFFARIECMSSDQLH